MPSSRVQNKAVAQFTCLGAECPDTCCQGWEMQLTTETVEHYRRHAPELLASVEAAGDSFRMKREAGCGACVRLEAGLCATHRDYGEDFLGDACHFFPRITRALGGTMLTAMALSCPEAARLMLTTPDAFAHVDRQEVRVPYSIRNYLPEGMGEGEALDIHHAFLQLAESPEVEPEQALLRVSAVARALAMQPITAWGEAMPLYCAMADGRIPPAELKPADPFHLVQALQGLVRASTDVRPQLHWLTQAMAEMLGISFDEGGAMRLTEDASVRAVRVLVQMREQAPQVRDFLRRYVQAQVAQAHFPFAGFGGTLAERVTIIGVRYATVKLALATLGKTPSAAEVVRVVQTLSRFMDHLADPQLSLQIYQETGWLREPRLRALVVG